MAATSVQSLPGKTLGEVVTSEEQQIICVHQLHHYWVYGAIKCTIAELSWRRRREREGKERKWTASQVQQTNNNNDSCQCTLPVPMAESKMAAMIETIKLIMIRTNLHCRSIRSPCTMRHFCYCLVIIAFSLTQSPSNFIVESYRAYLVVANFGANWFAKILASV